MKNFSLTNKQNWCNLYAYWLQLSDKIKFLLVGGANTVFSYLLFCVLQYTLKDKLHYLTILILSHFISVFNSFVTMKYLVFHSRGSFVLEYLKVNVTYLVYLALNAILLFVFVEKLAINLFIAQVMCIVTLTVFSYLAHKHFSFKQSTSS